MVSSSQQESSRNAVEGAPGRVDTLQGQSNLTDEKSINLMFSRRGLSRTAVEGTTGRERHQPKPQLSHLSSRMHIFGISKGFQEKHSKFKVSLIMMIVLMIQDSLAAHNFMTERLVDIFTKKLDSKFTGAHRKAFRRNNKDFRKVCPNATRLSSKEDIKRVSKVLKLDGSYKKIITADRDNNDIARACISSIPGRLKFNFSTGLPEHGTFPGFSARFKDARIYSVQLEGRPYYILTVLQTTSHYIIMPYTIGKAIHIRVYSTLKNWRKYEYIKFEPEAAEEDPVLKVLEEDIDLGWRVPPQTNKAPAQYVRHKDFGRASYDPNAFNHYGWKRSPMPRRFPGHRQASDTQYSRENQFPYGENGSACEENIGFHSPHSSASYGNPMHGRRAARRHEDWHRRPSQNDWSAWTSITKAMRPYDTTPRRSRQSGREGPKRRIDGTAEDNF